ncbi:MAG: MaoC family dehydratase [Sphingomonas fennica]
MAWLDDLTVGDTRRYGPRAVTREAVLDFARTYDPQPFHLDDEAAAKTHFGRLAASGFQTASLMMAMFVEGEPQDGGTMGGIGIDELRWLAPVYPGDTLTMEGEVLAVTPSRSKPDRGSSRVRWTAFNQDSKPVLSLIAIGLHRRRGDRTS